MTEWEFEAAASSVTPGGVSPVASNSPATVADTYGPYYALVGKFKRGRRLPPGVYEGPGVEAGFVVVPAVVVVALISAIIVAVVDASSNALRAGFTGVVTGVVAWIGLWELFSRLHPRFSQGLGDNVKWLVVVGGPPLITLAAVVLAR